MITLRLPAPPSANALFSNVPGKGRVKTAAYRSWLNVAGWDVVQQRQSPIKGEVALDILCEKRKGRRPDLGNMDKAIEDLLVKHALIEDDRFVVDVRLRFAPVTGVVVTVTGVAA